MTQARRVTLKPDTDLVQILEEVHRDRVARIIERDGEPLALVLPPDAAAAAVSEPASRRNRERLLALAAAWRDLDVDGMIEDVYQARHASPPSPLTEP